MGLCLANPTDKYVDRNALALVPTPAWTPTWHPVPHIDVVDAVESAICNRGMTIASERFGLARDQQKMFGVITLTNRNNPEWTRCIGIRNSHDQSFAAGICCGVSVLVCSNLCFGGEFVIKRRHTSGIDLFSMVEETMDAMTDSYLLFEERLLNLHDIGVTDNQARIFIVKAAEYGAIPSCDILAVFNEYLEPRHEEFRERTQWSLLNAFTEIAHKYKPARFDLCNRKLTRLFALDGQPALT
ncbi:MAG: DUF932 domain-containing protein [Victivallales bacterium]|nr:DUF932 domain-containing protein [Victivallales bacterium]